MKEGDLIWVTDPAAVGSEQQGKRPALVVSCDAFNQTGIAIVCAVSSHRGSAHATRTPLEVAIPKGLAIQGVVLTEQVRTIDWKARGISAAGNAGRTTLLEVRVRLRKILAI